MPIEIISTLVPKNNQPFPTHEAQFGKGGWRSVPTQADRDSLPQDRREVGMAVYVQDEQQTYTLNSDLATWSVFVGGGGIPDAPQDGKGYVRSDGQWKEIDDFLDEGTYA